MHLGIIRMADCSVSFSGHCDLDYDLGSRIGITSIFFEVGIPSLECGFFLGWPSVAYHFLVTVTLTSDLVFTIIMFGAFFSILFELGIPKLVCGCFFGWQSVMYQFCDLNLISRIILSGAYFIYYMREESQICFTDTSLDADVSHTFLGHSFFFTYDLVSRIIVSGAYLLYYLM